MAGNNIFGNTAKGVGGLAKSVVKDVAKEPGKIFESATGSSSPAPAGGGPSPATGPVSAPRSQPVVDGSGEQEEINRLSQQIKNEVSAPIQPKGRNVEEEIAQVREEKQVVAKDIEDEDFLKNLQEEREREQQEAAADAQEIIPQSKPSRGAAPSAKTAGTKELGKKRSG